MKYKLRKTTIFQKEYEIEAESLEEAKRIANEDCELGENFETETEEIA